MNKNKIKYSELKELLDNSSSFLSGKYPHRYIAFDLQNSNNNSITELLLEFGYWDFAPNRSKKIVYYHQIIAFFFVANDKPSGSGDIVEIHHLDGNTVNNHPSNLRYLSSRDHSIVTQFQRKFTRKIFKLFYKNSDFRSEEQDTPFNNQGKPVRNWLAFIKSIIALTIKLTSIWLSQYQPQQIKFNLKKLISHFNSFFKYFFNLPLLEIPLFEPF